MGGTDRMGLRGVECAWERSLQDRGMQWLGKFAGFTNGPCMARQGEREVRTGNETDQVPGGGTPISALQSNCVPERQGAAAKWVAQRWTHDQRHITSSTSRRGKSCNIYINDEVKSWWGADWNSMSTEFAQDWQIRGKSGRTCSLNGVEFCKGKEYLALPTAIELPRLDTPVYASPYLVLDWALVIDFQCLGPPGLTIKDSCAQRHYLGTRRIVFGRLQIRDGHVGHILKRFVSVALHRLQQELRYYRYLKPGTSVATTNDILHHWEPDAGETAPQLDGSRAVKWIASTPVSKYCTDEALSPHRHLIGSRDQPGKLGSSPAPAGTWGWLTGSNLAPQPALCRYLTLITHIAHFIALPVTVIEA
ncbi:uncharacterized protein CLUP02_11577 [Colletotrichum lupini]|uniref:Uncharacterized protein n=1 Tax=Colletotrichum lupini TaxID=145971 RepID=A0A9Q8WKF4_9PEZI|nr:uncharacterized protein CLUP02_11577 [Colletotrichum lupini]UQC86077.1 hypothetical protein CLUP02_11577 [Colletotrichum lupini]